MVNFQRPTDEAIVFIAENMRESDAVEVRASGHEDLQEALEKSMSISDYSTVVVSDDGIPLAVFGLVKASPLTNCGTPWFISSKFALQYRRAFLTLSKYAVREMLDICPRLVNHVHVENKVSIRWLEWMGFTIEESVESVLTGEMFHRFYMER